MKLVIFFITVACLQVSARVLAQKVTLNEKDAPLEKVFSDIKKQTGYIFFYEKNTLDGTSKVSIDVKNVDLREVLNICFTNQPLTYTIAGTTIGVKKKESAVIQPQIVQAPKDITGQVLDKNGVPLVGATVLIKRTKTGTLTDVKGNFTLRGVSPDDIITVTYLGYKPLEIKIGENTVFNLVMEETNNKLDQVVIQAYGQTSQRKNTGNIATVSSAEIERQPVMNALEALIGKVPGLVITQNSGYASAPFKVEVRGRSVIDPSRSSEPLYVIDGVPLTVLDISGNYASGSTGFLQNGIGGPAGGQSPFFSINPNDIESISVLKDADATAIYGSRGANGVIIITTKKGKIGKTKFDLNAYQGVSEVTRNYEMLNTQQYLTMRREAFKNSGQTMNSGNAYDLIKWDTSRYTNWQKYLWGGLGKTTDVGANLSGGDKLTTFRIGGAYHRETDILTVSGANQRASMQFNLSHNSLDQRLNISFTSTYSYAESNLISVPNAVTAAPDAPAVFDSQGNLNWAGWQPASNPFSSLLTPYTAKTGFLNSHLVVKYELLKGLSFSTSFGYSTMHNSQIFLQPIVSQNPLRNPTGTADFGNNNNANAIVEPQLEYKRTISKGVLDAQIGGSVQSVLQDGNHIIGQGYTNDNLLRSVSNAPTRYALDNNGEYKYAAIFLRINYNWEDKYIINLSARRDGSSRFGPGKQFGNFGAVGGAWIFTEENWFKANLGFLSFGKLRGSYGLTGSDNIGDYNYLSAWSNVSSNYESGLPSYIPLGHSNPNLEWQVNKKLETALDLGFLKDRINLEIAWYQNRCGNQLALTPLPIITGFSFVTTNLPATIQNTGLEFTINAKIIDKKDFSWSLNFDIGANRNKLISFPNLALSPYANQFRIGQPLSLTYLLHYTGVSPQTGQYTFEDKNHDGVIDRTIGDPSNDLYAKDLSVKADGGFGTDLRYKSWQLNLYFHFRDQPFVKSNIASIGTPGQFHNFPVEIMNRWQKPGDIAQFARFTTQPQITDAEFYGNSDGVYSNGSYIRLQNLSLSFELPANWSKNIGMLGCKIYVRGQNLFLITKYHGLDPDTPVFGGLPPAKIFTGGVQFNF